MAIEIQTAQNVNLYYQTAKLGDRILAYFIDMLVIIGLIISLIVTRNFLFYYVVQWWSLELFFSLVILLVWFFYMLLLEIFLNGQTLGKRQRKIKVIRLDGTSPRLADYFLRWLISPIDNLFFGIPAMVCITIQNKGQRLGDVASGTTVVKVQTPISLPELLEFYQINNQHHQTKYTQAIWLSEYNIKEIRNSLLKYQRDQNIKPLIDLYEKIKDELKINTDYPPIPFLETILQDYNYLTNEQESRIYHF